MDSSTILILTCPEDDTADEVADILGDRGASVARIDTGDFPLQLRSTTILDEPDGWSSILTTSDGQSVDLRQVMSVWYRRPTHFRLPDGMSPADKAGGAAVRD